MTAVCGGPHIHLNDMCLTVISYDFACFVFHLDNHERVGDDRQGRERILIIFSTHLKEDRQTKMMRPVGISHLFTLASFLCLSCFADRQKISYTAYYSDDKCTDLQGLRAFISESPTIVPVTDRTDLSCETLMTCFLDVGNGCSPLIITGTTNITYLVENQGRDLYVLDSTNTLVGELDRSKREPDICYNSSILPTCHLRAITATMLAANPGLLIGETNQGSSSMSYKYMSFFY